QRQRGVKHGVHDIDEWNMGDNYFEKIGPQIGDCTHQQAAGRATFNGNLVAGAVVVGHQKFRAVDKVGEGVHLVHHASGVMPGLAQVTTTPDVNVGHHYTP